MSVPCLIPADYGVPAGLLIGHDDQEGVTFYAPPGSHSMKPIKLRTWCEYLAMGAPTLELWARKEWSNW